MRHSKNILASILLSIALTACTVFTPTADPSVFYKLTTEATSPLPHPYTGEILVIMPVLIPAYLDRPQVVQVSEKHTLKFSEYARWSEPFGDGVTRVIRENLATLIGSQNIRQFPYHGDRSGDVKLYLRSTISQFEADTNGLITLTANWTITDNRNVKIHFSGERTITQKATNTNKGEIVNAMSQCLTELCRAIADTLPLKTTDNDATQ